MSLEGWDERAFQKQFEADLRNAQKKAGRKIGPKVVRAAQERLGSKAGPKQKKKIYFKVRKKGTFVVVDANTSARAHNFGADIHAKGKGMRVPLNPQYRDRPIKFVVRTKSGQVLGFGQTSKGMAPIAVMRRKITIRQIAKSKQLRPILESYFDTFLKEMRNALYGG